MYLKEALAQHIGQWVTIFCHDGGVYPSSGILCSLDDPLLILKKKKDYHDKTYIVISTITRFTAYPDYLLK